MCFLNANIQFSRSISLMFASQRKWMLLDCTLTNFMSVGIRRIETIMCAKANGTERKSESKNPTFNFRSIPQIRSSCVCSSYVIYGYEFCRRVHSPRIEWKNTRTIFRYAMCFFIIVIMN